MPTGAGLTVRGAAGVLMFAAVLLAAACGGGDSAPPTPSPSATEQPTPEPTPAPPETPYRFVWRQFGATQDTIWAVAPTDPTHPQALAMIDHQEGFGVKPSLSPDQQYLAYITLPDGATDVSFQSDLHVRDLQTGDDKFITGQVDLRFQPLWSPDSKLLYVRRNLEQRSQVLRVKVPRTPREGERTPTPTPSPPPGQPPEDPVTVVMDDSVSHVLSFTPVGFADDGVSMFFVQVQGGTGGGTLLGEFGPATYDAVVKAEAAAKAAQQAYTDAVNAAIAANQPTPSPLPTPAPSSKLVANLSDQIASDYDLSPDKHKFSFLAQQLVDGQIVARAYVTDLITTETIALPTDGLPTGDHQRPLWYPDTSLLTVGVLAAAETPSAVALVPPGGGAPAFMPAPPSGYDVPRAWSLDSTYLAVVNFSVNSRANPGTATLQLLSRNGQRITLGGGADIEVLGWFQPPPAPTPTP
jgi:hypothetical protein